MHVCWSYLRLFTLLQLPFRDASLYKSAETYRNQRCKCHRPQPRRRVGRPAASRWRRPSLSVRLPSWSAANWLSKNLWMMLNQLMLTSNKPPLKSCGAVKLRRNKLLGTANMESGKAWNKQSKKVPPQTDCRTLLWRGHLSCFIVLWRGWLTWCKH